MPLRLHAIDLALIAVYLIGITVFGLRFRKADSSLSSYFLAARSVPWWAIALSIVSAETSTLTIISVPGIAFGGDFTFLQLVFGYMIGRLLICVLFLPRYFEGELFTAYQLIERRFGHRLHKVTAGLFLLTRAAAEGVRVYAVSIVVGIAIGTNDILSIVIISLLTLVYTFEGGMAAVIWTDVVQMGLYVAGTVIALFTLGARIDGGWTTVHAVTSAAGKLHVLNFALNLTTTYTFWAGLIGGAFLTMASHGTDQLMVQRLLAARNLRDARVALLASGGVVLLQFTLFLLIGAGLYVFYGQHPAALTVKGSDRLFPAFIVQQMPVGIAGLLIAAILAAAMSNLSAALNSLSSTTIVEFYLRLRPGATDRRRNLLSRVATVVWAVVLVGIAIYAVAHGGKGHVVETGLSIASVAYGSLLGVFLLGTLTRYATEAGAIAGMVTGFALNLALWLQPAALHVSGVTLPKIAYTWYVLIGSVVTFAVGSLASVAGVSRRRAGLVAVLTCLFCAPAARGQSYDFSEIDTVMQAALTARQLPGGVVVVGSGGRAVYEKAYGNRAEDPAIEPMTTDTIFDMASLSKCMSTSVAIMQMYEQGKLQFDDPVVKYLPEFAAAGKSTITVRQLLTHYSGLAPDVSLADAWSGKAEGIRRAMESVPAGPPGVKFVYSDINFITLGVIVEKLSGEPLDVYAAKHIFGPLGMVHTRYLPPAAWKPMIAPTAHNDDRPMADDRMLRGEVHDPTTRRMGGVAGHAGVFSDAVNVSLFAQALLDKLAGRPSAFPLKQATLELMCRPEQPVQAKGLRGYGWDIDTPYSRPRGDIYPVGSFGHTGFTGTSLWMDPRSDSYVILLANAVHPRGRPAISALRGKVATAAARALELTKAPTGMATVTGIDVLEETSFRALFYTYETVVGYFLEAAAKTGTPVLILDRPALTSGVQVGGPVSDAGSESYVDYMQEPMTLGLTLGELAGFFNGERHLGARLTVVPMRNWERGLWFDQTGVPWVNPSPNLRTMSAAALYPGIAFAEYTNLSIGRGSDAPLEQVGAPWIASDAEAQKLADTLNARKLSGVTFAPVSFVPAKPYPYAGETVHGVRMTVTDRVRLDAPAMGAELLAAVHTQYPTQFKFERAAKLILNDATMQALTAGKDAHEIAAAWEAGLAEFRAKRDKYLLYGYLPSTESPETVIPAKREAAGR